jgi:hypothetical protein
MSIASSSLLESGTVAPELWYRYGCYVPLVVVRVKLLVVFVLPVLMLRFGACTRAFHVGLSRVFGTDRAQREQSFEIFAAAFWTGRNIAFTDQLFECMSTFSTGVFVNRHSGVSITRHS